MWLNARHLQNLIFHQQKIQEKKGIIVWLTGDLWKCSAAFKVLPKICNLPQMPLHIQPSIVYNSCSVCLLLWDKCKHNTPTIYPLYFFFSLLCCPSLAMRWPNILGVESWWWGQRCWQMGERSIKWPLGTERGGGEQKVTQCCLKGLY